MCTKSGAPDSSNEWVVKYFRSRVEGEFSDVNGLLTIRTQGFTPAKALEINRSILNSSERCLPLHGRGIELASREQHLLGGDAVGELVDEALGQTAQALAAYRQALQYDANLQAVQAKIDALSKQLGK